MKKIKLLVVTLIALLALPFCVNAAKDPIKIHIFKGDGCPHCAEAIEFFENIEGEYGEYFDLVEHEVWYNEDNAELMTKVASFFGDDVTGVPYIIIGEKTFQGYSDTYNSEIINLIKKEYNSGEFVDYVAQVENGEASSIKSSKEENKDNITIIIIAVAVIGCVALIFFARDSEVSEDEKETVVKEKVVEEPKKEVAKKSTPKKSTAKKTTSTKKSTTAKKTTAKKTTTKKTTTTKKPTTKKTTKK